MNKSVKYDLLHELKFTLSVGLSELGSKDRGRGFGKATGSVVVCEIMISTAWALKSAPGRIP